MILILTYHRICQAREATTRKFYTVTDDVLALQLKALRSGRFRAIRAADLELEQPRDGDVPFAVTFDDGTADHFEIAAPLLREAGCTGIFFVPTATLDTPGHLTGDQLSQLARAGHEIGCHSHEHKRLDVLPQNEMRNQIRTSLDMIADRIGVRPSWFAPPGGFINRALRDISRELGIKAIRTMQWGCNRAVDPFSLQCIPINRNTSESQYRSIIAGREPAWQKLLYAGKEGIKCCLPMRTYSKLRDALLSAAREK